MGLMTGKKGVIFGVANDRIIAWGIARKLHEEGAALAFTYLNEVFEKRVRPLAESLGADAGLTLLACLMLGAFLVWYTKRTP